MPPDDDDDARRGASEIAALSHRIQPLLAGKGPQIQSGVLADLTSLWLAGHHPALRAEVLAMHLELVRDLVAASEKEIFGEARHPGWQDVQ